MIYTKTGDKGTTSLANGERVPKTDARIEAYGTVDELNSWIGLLRAQSVLPSSDTQSLLPPPDTQLEWIQNKLFNLGAELSDAPGEWIKTDDVSQLEQWIDAMQAVVPKQRAFLLPAGSETVCRCHVCRTICRRAERRMIEMNAADTDLQFINRLSDYLFVLARYVAYACHETEIAWKQDWDVEKLTE